MFEQEEREFGFGDLMVIFFVVFMLSWLVVFLRVVSVLVRVIPVGCHGSRHYRVLRAVDWCAMVDDGYIDDCRLE